MVWDASLKRNKIDKEKQLGANLQNSGLVVLKNTTHEDSRGYFRERYNPLNLKELHSPKFVQENYSISNKGVIRGLHWQVNPQPQAKLVTCLKGNIFDVVLDIRKTSITFGKFFEIELNEFENVSLWIPAGFAHGFQSLEKDSIVVYSTTSIYSLENSRSINPLDARLGIQWPLSRKFLGKQDEISPNFNEVEEKDFF